MDKKPSQKPSRTERDQWQFDANETATSDEESGPLGRIGAALQSRRGFMNSAARVGVGAAALGAVGTGTVAAEGNSSPADSDYEKQNQFGYGALTDVQIVKFALLLERLEATFYTEAVGDTPIMLEGGSNGAGPDARLTEHQVERSDVAKQLANPSLRYSTFVRFKQIREHEQAHVAALEGVLDEVGADSDFASDVEFEFPYDTFGEFLDLARAFEDTGAGAYTAAAPAVDTEEYLASAAQIDAIENRHASYIRTLNNPLPAGSGAQNPFPNAFQPRLSVSTVVGRIEPFVVGADAEDIMGLLGMSGNDMPEMASATFDDQSTDGSSVTVASAALPDGGFVAIHDSSLLDGNVAGSVIGVSEKYDAGTVMNVEVPLYSGVPGGDYDQSSLDGDQTLIAMPHYDTNGNGSYDFITSGGDEDGAYTQDGSAVIDKAQISVE